MVGGELNTMHVVCLSSSPGIQWDHKPGIPWNHSLGSAGHLVELVKDNIMPRSHFGGVPTGGQWQSSAPSPVLAFRARCCASVQRVPAALPNQNRLTPGEVDCHSL